jgi:hypothetical protein
VPSRLRCVTNRSCQQCASPIATQTLEQRRARVGLLLLHRNLGQRARVADTVIMRRSWRKVRVGIVAVQLLKARGAHVVATASTDDEIAFVRDHGADDVVDYRGDLVATVRREHPGGVDAVLHFAGDGAVLAALLTPGGGDDKVIGSTWWLDQGGRSRSATAGSPTCRAAQRVARLSGSRVGINQARRPGSFRSTGLGHDPEEQARSAGLL